MLMAENTSDGSGRALHIHMWRRSSRRCMQVLNYVGRMGQGTVVGSPGKPTACCTAGQMMRLNCIQLGLTAALKAADETGEGLGVPLGPDLK